MRGSSSVYTIESVLESLRRPSTSRGGNSRSYPNRALGETHLSVESRTLSCKSIRLSWGAGELPGRRVERASLARRRGRRARRRVETARDERSATLRPSSDGVGVCGRSFLSSARARAERGAHSSHNRSRSRTLEKTASPDPSLSLSLSLSLSSSRNHPPSLGALRGCACAGAGHSLAAVGPHLVLFGGVNRQRFLQDLFLLHTPSARWSQPALAGPRPSPRMRCALAPTRAANTVCAVDARENHAEPHILLFGGTRAWGDDSRTQRHDGDLFTLRLEPS